MSEVINGKITVESGEYKATINMDSNLNVEIHFSTPLIKNDDSQEAFFVKNIVGIIMCELGGGAND